MYKLMNSEDDSTQCAPTMGDISDGYHTFNELYDHRAKLFAAIVNHWKSYAGVKSAWKSMQHHDPKFPMYDGMFIVGMDTVYGQITYHYDIDPYWEMFTCPTVDRATEFDGHTPDDAIARILELATAK